MTIELKVPTFKLCGIANFISFPMKFHVHPNSFIFKCLTVSWKIALCNLISFRTSIATGKNTLATDRRGHWQAFLLSLNL